MSRYVLRFKGRGAMPAADVAQIRSASGLSVVDDSSARMLLVQASQETANRLAEALPDWICTPERTIPLPDTRQKTRSS